MRLTVIGLGYLGATHAVCMAELGHEVLGVETDVRRCVSLASGCAPFYEPGLSELLARHVRSGRLHVTSSFARAAEWSEVFFVTVGTPPKIDGPGTDLSQVESAIDSLVPHLTHDVVIFGKSTVPVGTAQGLARRSQCLARGIGIEISWNPEFLREGHAIKDTLHPDRIVLGRTPGGCAEALVREIYAPILAAGIPLIITDTATAELVKITANAFLATKISFINAVAEVCAAAGADVRAVADGIGHDPRIGRQFLNAGLGFGGGCLPKDIRAFIDRAAELGASESLAFLREVDNVNRRRRTRIVEVTRTACGGCLTGMRAAVLGAAFKPESDDIRDSPALTVAAQLHAQGATVTVFDPRAAANSKAAFPALGYADSVMGACAGADVVLVLTEWNEFVSLDPFVVGEVVRRRTVVDGRMCLDGSKWQEAGWDYRT